MFSFYFIDKPIASFLFKLSDHDTVLAAQPRVPAQLLHYSGKNQVLHTGIVLFFKIPVVTGWQNLDQPVKWSLLPQTTGHMINYLLIFPQNPPKSFFHSCFQGAILAYPPDPSRVHASPWIRLPFPYKMPASTTQLILDFITGEWVFRAHHTFQDPYFTLHYLFAVLLESNNWIDMEMGEGITTARISLLDSWAASGFKTDKEMIITWCDLSLIQWFFNQGTMKSFQGCYRVPCNISPIRRTNTYT